MDTGPSENEREGLNGLEFFGGSILLFLAGAFIVCKICTVVSPAYDLGLIPLGSDLLIRGGLIYRDLHTVMLPGSYFILAAIFLIFGSSMLVCQLTLVITILTCTLMVLLIGRRFIASAAVFLPPAFLLVLGTFGNGYNSHHWDSLLLVLTYTYLLLNWEWSSSASKNSTLLFSAGIVGGLSVLTYQNQLLPVFAGALAVFLVSRRKVPGMAWRNLTLVTSGLVTVFTLFLAYLIYTGTAQVMLDNTFFFVLNRYLSVNKVQYAWSNFESVLVGTTSYPWIVFAALPFGVLKLVPLLVALGFFAVLCGPRLKRAKFEELNPGVIFLYLIAFALWLAEMHKPDLKRLIFGESLLMICLFYQLSLIQIKPARFLLSGFQIALAMGLAVNAGTISSFYSGKIPEYDTARGKVRSLANLTILERLAPLLKPYEMLLVYPYDTGIVYLAKVSIPGGFPVLHYGYHSKEQFEKVLAALDQNRVRFVIRNLAQDKDLFLESGFQGYRHPQASSLIMEPYLKKNYKHRATYSNYELLERLD